MKSSNPELKIKPYSAKQLSSMYVVCKPTFLKWIQPFTEEIGKRNGHYYTVAQVIIIFDKIGEPPQKSVQEFS